MKTNYIRIFLAVTFLEGLISLFTLFQIPSEEENALIMGFSSARIGLAGLLTCILILVGVLLFLSLRNREDWKKLQKKFEIWLDRDDVFITLFAVLFFLFFLLLFLVVIFETGNAHFLGTPYMIFQRAKSTVLWFAAIAAQFLILINVLRRVKISRLITYEGIFWKTTMICALLGSSILHWVILAFRLPIFTSIPGWFWYFRNKQFASTDLLFIPLIFLAFLIVWFVLKNPGKVIRNLVLLVLLGYFLQVGFGFVDGGGYDTIRDKDAGGGHRRYAAYACDEPDILDTLLNYDVYYLDDTYLTTKPPGVMLFYLVTQKISNMIDPVNTYDGRLLRLMDFAARIFPLISFLVLFVIYNLSRRIFSVEKNLLAYSPAILFVFLPNIILMPLTLYQVLYPLLFSFAVLFTLNSILRKSLWLALITGIYYYAALYFSFALLPIIPFGIILTGIYYLFYKSTYPLKDILKVYGGISLGLIIAFFAFRELLNYDFFLRYEAAMDYHRYYDFIIRIQNQTSPIDDSFYPNLFQIVQSLRLNNLDFFSWIGFPLALLFISRVIRAIFAGIHNSAKLIDLFTISFFITYLALNLFGETQSEVGRIWLGLTPAFVLCGGYELMEIFNYKKRGIFFIISLQLITMMTLFKFQDFYL